MFEVTLESKANYDALQSCIIAIFFFFIEVRILCCYLEQFRKSMSEIIDHISMQVSQR